MGGDYLQGQGGNDLYNYNVGDGFDTILEAGTTSTDLDDRIVFGAGITLSNLSFQRLGTDTLQIAINAATAGQITIEDQFNGGGSVEKLQFSDGSIYTLTDKSYTTYGTSSNDSIAGISSGGLIADTIYLNAGDDSSYAGAGNDTVYGGDGVDRIYGEDGDDILYGDNGGDTLNGGAGADTLYGGAGNDTLIGSNGADIYVYGGGDDIISEQAGAAAVDELRFLAGITLSSLTLTRVNTNDLRIDVSGGGSILIEDQFNYNAGINSIDTIRFADNSTLNLMTRNYLSQGTVGNDTLSGVYSGGGTADTIHLYEGNDISYAGAGNDTVYGGDGADFIDGEDGNDILYGDAGNDTIEGGAGLDTIYGGAGDDTLKGKGDNDIYIYGGGNDIIDDNAATGTDELRFLAGITSSNLTFTRINATDLKIDITGGANIVIQDQFYNSSSQYALETIRFSNNATINLLTRAYVTQGTSGNDTLNGITGGGSTVDTLYLNAGNDISYAGAGDDTVYGGDGTDFIDGEDGNDILYGDAGNDTIEGGAGLDTIYGGAGDDTLKGEGDNDIYIYGGGNDIIDDNAATGTDELRFLAGITSSSLTFTRINATDLKIDIAGGTNIVIQDQFYNSSSQYALETIRFSNNATINLLTKTYVTQGTSGNDSISGIVGGGSTADTIYLNAGNDAAYAGIGNDTVYGGDGADFIDGEDGDDILYGDAGNDTIEGGAGLDTIYGGAGDDTLKGEGDNDIYIYGGGNDIIDDNAATGTDELRFLAGITSSSLTFTRINAADLKIDIAGGTTIVIQDQFYNSSSQYALETIRFADNSTIDLLAKAYVTQGTSGNDSLNGILGGGATADTIYLNDGNDISYGGVGNDTIYGGNGIDTLYGDDGDDFLYGDAANDILSGGNGLDYIRGGAGADTLTGGAAKDTFYFDTAALGSSDTITDFTIAQADVLNIKDLLVGYNPVQSAIDNFVSFTTSGSNTIMSVDRDGLGSAHTSQAVATLNGVTGLDADTMLANNTLIAA